LPRETLTTAVDVARALAHPARIRLLAMLREGELCVCHLTCVLALAPSTVSAHLRELRQAGLVEQRKSGRWIHVRLSDQPNAQNWLDRVFADVETDPQVERDADKAASLRTDNAPSCSPADAEGVSRR
jgi:DNA-binding transcriptional ArsR family regulator